MVVGDRVAVKELDRWFRCRASSLVKRSSRRRTGVTLNASIVRIGAHAGAEMTKPLDGSEGCSKLVYPVVGSALITPCG
jgi:hypothetical protein